MKNIKIILEIMIQLCFKLGPNFSRFSLPREEICNVLDGFLDWPNCLPANDDRN